MKIIDLFKKITIAIFCAVIVVLPILHIAMPDTKISQSERRALASLPKLQLDSLMSGVYVQNLEKYLNDQFPLREFFRGIGSSFELISGRQDVNDIYSHNGYLIALDPDFSEDAVKKSADKLYYAAQKFTDGEIYSSLIPSKEWFIKDGVHAYLDFDKLNEVFYADHEFTDIRIDGELSLEDYYKSDSHWRQENLTELARFIVESMGYDAPEIEYTENIIENFSGVYAGQSAVWLDTENIVYLTNENTSNVKVESIGGDADKLYTTEKVGQTVDMYDVYLGGAVPLIFIENENAVNDATIVVFRDSYGSSFIPLLSDYFTTIIAVDFRYVSLDNALKFCEGYTADAVLSMLSPGIVKNGEMMKIDMKK